MYMFFLNIIRFLYKIFICIKKLKGNVDVKNFNIFISFLSISTQFEAINQEVRSELVIFICVKTKRCYIW